MGTNWRLTDFSIEHWQAAYALWKQVPGMGLSASDEASSIDGFLKRNLGLSLVALCEDSLVATILAGNDGRRGYIYHACVDPAHQGHGIGKAMVSECLRRLKAAGLIKASLYCKADNEMGQAFWAHIGWQQRPDLALFSMEL